MAVISKTVVEEIISRTNIEELISGYVSLKRAGSVHKGLCPFHNEKSPSFIVYPSTESFYCFGCGIGGDAVAFIKQMEHLDYPEAIEFLGKRIGITVVRENDNYDNKNERRIRSDRFYAMNTEAAKFFHNALMSNTPESKAALEYFTVKRKLSIATVKHFGLGYAPNSFDLFSKHMLSKGYTYDELVAGFLCGKSEKGNYYDAFRNRAMFPIFDVSGNLIAFGGRALDDKIKPKYKNSSDTPVFKKSRNLYALNFARHSCKDTLILCEGYMDVIALHSAGFTNAVATLGTAITAEQARLMSRYTKKVIICYDSDEPGQIAANKALGIIKEVGLDARVIVIPGSKDPDEFIKTYGSERFKKLLTEAKMEFEYKMDNLLVKYDINSSQDRITLLGMLEKLISEVNSEAERDIYIQTVSKKLEVAAQSIKSDVQKLVGKRAYTRKKEQGKRAIEGSLGFTDRVNPDYAKAPSIAKTEETILGLLMLYDEHKKKVFEQNLLSEEDFFTQFNKRVFKFIKDTYSGETQSDINEIFNVEEVGRITKMKISRMVLTDNGDRVLIESINSLKSSMQMKVGIEPQSLDDLQNLINNLRKKID